MNLTTKITKIQKIMPTHILKEEKITNFDGFSSDFKTVAIANQKYELSRFWIIGTWIAKQVTVTKHTASA